MPAHTAGLDLLRTWAARVTALTGRPLLHVPDAGRTADRTAGCLCRADRRAARRAARATASTGRRYGSDAVVERRLGPVTRGSAILTGAALLVGGGLGVSGAAGYGVAAGAGYGGTTGVIAAVPAERSLSAQAARLAGQGQGLEAADRAESLAVAGAALDAAAAVVPLTAQTGDVVVGGELDAAVQRLAGLVDASRDAGAGRMQADVPLPVAPAAAAAAAAVDANEAAGVAPGSALTRALSDAAGEVFRLSMQVETLSGATPQAAPVVRTGSLQTLESVVSTAGQAATALGELTPLTPLTEEERLARGLLGDEGETVPGRVRSTARLRVDALPSVAAFVTAWENGRVPTDALCVVPFATDHRLQCDAAAALARLNVAYRAAFGSDLAVVSSYRPLETQVALRASKGGLAAVPGTSNHGWGIAVDFGGIGGLGQFDKPGYLWLKEHAAAYGWHHPEAMEPGGGGPPEPWHWEFGTD